MGEKLFSKGEEQKNDQRVLEEGLREYREEDKTEQKDAPLPTLASTQDFYQQNGEEYAEEVYSWYASAMERRDREPLSQDRFIYHFFENGSTESTYLYGEAKNGYLMGIEKYGVFIPTHFAPKTLKGGVRLIAKLGDDQKTPAVMAITPDLKETILKLPSWHQFNLGFLADFRGEIHEKEIVYNTNPKVKQLLVGLLQEYFEKENIKPDINVDDLELET